MQPLALVTFPLDGYIDAASPGDVTDQLQQAQLLPFPVRHDTPGYPPRLQALQIEGPTVARAYDSSLLRQTMCLCQDHPDRFDVQLAFDLRSHYSKQRGLLQVHVPDNATQAHG